ncbi:MAG: Rne/Rng family ribonuclease [Marinosulfonomonas sp.]
MAKKMLIDATHAEETRVVVVDGNKVEEFDFESENKRQLAGNIYLAKVTRVEPSLQAAFIDYGGNRHGFLAFSEIHPDYYQIPIADREALMAEERAYAEALAAEEEEKSKKVSRSRSRSRSRNKTKATENKSDDAVATKPAEIPGMDVVDLDDGNTEADHVVEEGTSPAFTVDETPVDTPASNEEDATDTDSPSEAATETSVEAEEETSELTPEVAAELEDAGNDYDDADVKTDATEKDSSIEDVADEDVVEETRRPRKVRPRKYKIQEVIKVRQILLVQVVKEERGNKGAALTTYLSLAGRYCVLMPNTARGGGISRKITNAADRKKLKEIANEIEVPQGAGLIIRTAGSQRTKTEIKRDYEYLQRMWEQIRELTLQSTAPTQIYEEGNLIKRSIRDLYNKDIDEVFVEGEAGYRVAKDFMKMIMPSHAKNVKLYNAQMPLFARYQVESYLSSMFNPTVQLKSGGYIVIGVTEALVAIDVNSGRATKEASIEDTATKTNLEAAEEVARQLRLRDLAGLIVIDFIDMEERKNNAAVEKRFKDKLKTDRARIQVGRISGFGLMEMSRQRLRPGMIEATTQLCNHCHGTGLIRSDDNLALNILRQLEEEGVRRRSREVLVKAPVSVANFLVNQKREHIGAIESRHGLSVRVEADPFLISPDFSIEKFKTATRIVAEAPSSVVSGDASVMADIDEEETTAEAVEAVETPTEGDAPAPKKRRRRRRRRKPSGANAEGAANTTDGTTPAENADQPSADPTSQPVEAAAEPSSSDTVTSEPAEAAAPAEAVDAAADAEAPKKKPTRRRTRKTTPKTDAAEAAPSEAKVEDAPAEVAEEKPAPKKRRSRAKKVVEETAETAPSASEAPASEVTPEAAEDAPKPKRARRSRAKTPKAVAAEAVEAAEAVVSAPAAEQAPAAPAPEPAPEQQVQAEPDAPSAPKKKGWWSLGR